MSGLSRYDFFRMLLPGALVVVLLDVAARIIALHSGAAFHSVDRFPGFLEDPLRGLAAAFGIGFVLYFLDPGYGAPQYYRGIPSTHLAQLLRDRGIKADALSLYFLSMEELMPDAFRERALLYGAIYRVGFQLVLYTLLVASLLPTAILILFRSLPPLNYGVPSLVLWVSWGAVVLAVIVPFLRQAIRSKPSWPRRGVVFATFTMTGLSLAAWTNLPLSFLPTVPPIGFALTTTFAVVGVWLLLRLVGPLGIWFQYLRGELRGKPDMPHSATEIAALDGSVAITGLVGIIVLWPALLPPQIIAISTLLLLGLMLSGFRKHERQLSGIYRNQCRWLEGKLESVLKLLPAEEQPKEPPAAGAQPQGEAAGLSASGEPRLARLKRWLGW